MIISIIIIYSESKSNQAQFRCIWPLNEVNNVYERFTKTME